MNAALNFAERAGEADVGAEHEGEAAAGRRTVDRGDHRLGQRAQVRDQPGDVLLHGEAGLCAAEALGVRRRAVAAEVEAGAEATAGAGEDDDAHGASAAMSSRWACNAWTISVVSALSFSGRFSVSWVMPGLG